MDWLDKHNLRHWLAGDHEDYVFYGRPSGPPLAGFAEEISWAIPPFHVPPTVRDSPDIIVRFPLVATE
jgi:hypothetical protein